MKTQRLIKSNSKRKFLRLRLSHKQLYIFSVLAILLLAISLRLIGLNKGFWLDEYYSIRWLSKGDFWETTEALRDYDKPPLYFLLFYLWSQINSSEPFLRILSVIFDLGTVFIIIKWLKPYSKLASLLGGLYFATTPIMLRYAQEIRPYSLLLFATALGFYFASLIINCPHKKINYLGLTFSLSLAIATHLIGIMLILPIGFFIVAGIYSDRKKIDWSSLVFSLVIPGLVFGYFYFFFLEDMGKVAEKWWMPEISWYLIASTFSYIFDLPMSLNINLVFGVFVVSISSITLLSRSKRSFSLLLIIAAFTFWLQIIIYSLFKTPVFWYRIILPGIIPFIAFTFLQIADINKSKIRHIYIVAIIFCCLVFSSNWIFIRAKQPVEEYRAVTKIIEQEWQPNDLIIIYPKLISTTIGYYLDEVGSNRKIVFSKISNSQKPSTEIIKKIDNANPPQNIFFVFRDIETDVYQYLLSAIGSIRSYAIANQIKQPKNIYLLTIFSHDTYFINRKDTREQIIQMSQEKLGNPDFYRKEKLYNVACWKL